MKRIYLDVDGVLNCGQTTERFRGTYGIEPSRVALLRGLVEATGAEIVLCSTWRLYEGNFQEVRRALAVEGLVVVDVTPDWAEAANILDWPLRMSATYLRACEILAHLRQNPCEDYVVLDDSTLVGPWDRQQDPEGSAEVERRHVQPTWEQGLLPQHVEAAARLLTEVR